MVHTMFKWSSYNFIFDNYRELKLIYKIQYMKIYVYKLYIKNIMKNWLGQFHVKVMYDLCTVSVVLA